MNYNFAIVDCLIPSVIFPAKNVEEITQGVVRSATG